MYATLILSNTWVPASLYAVLPSPIALVPSSASPIRYLTGTCITNILPPYARMLVLCTYTWLYAYRVVSLFVTPRGRDYICWFRHRLSPGFVTYGSRVLV